MTSLPVVQKRPISPKPMQIGISFLLNTDRKSLVGFQNMRLDFKFGKCFEIKHNRSTQRYNHVCPICRRSINGLRNSYTPKLTICHWIVASPLQQFSTAVQHVLIRYHTMHALNGWTEDEVTYCIINHWGLRACHVDVLWECNDSLSVPDNYILLQCNLTAAQCIVIVFVYFCVYVAVCICGFVTVITQNCVCRLSPSLVCGLFAMQVLKFVSTCTWLESVSTRPPALNSSDRIDANSGRRSELQSHLCCHRQWHRPGAVHEENGRAVRCRGASC